MDSEATGVGLRRLFERSERLVDDAQGPVSRRTQTYGKQQKGDDSGQITLQSADYGIDESC